MELKGKLVRILDLQTGSTAKGTWQKQEFIVETTDQFPKNVCMSLWGDKVEFLRHFIVGEEILVQFNLESREHNQRWYTDARAWKIDKAANGNSTSSSSGSAGVAASTEELPVSEDPGGDLPF